jgi:predicted dehydrogenase
MKKLRVGVIGTGGIGVGAHLTGYEKLADKVEIVAICDIDEAKLTRASKRFGVSQTFTDYNEMLQLKDLDAVDVCTPNYMHNPISIAALRAGKHVLCEKPLALNAAQAEEMVEEGKKSGKLFMVGVNNRYRDESQKLKKMINRGELGQIYAARTGWVRRRGVPFWGDWFMEKAKAGGGPLIDIGVHMLDLTRWLMGNPKPVSVSGSTYHKIGDYRVTEWDKSDPVLAGAIAAGDQDKLYDVEDSAFAFVRFTGGITLELNVSWALNIDKEHNYCELYGDKAGSSLSPLTIYTEKDHSLVDYNFKTDNFETHHAEIAHFVDCIQNGTQLISPAQDAVEIMKILDALYKSAETGSEVRL